MIDGAGRVNKYHLLCQVLFRLVFGRGKAWLVAVVEAEDVKRTKKDGYNELIGRLGCLM
jgi:hypothetical protein